MRQKIVILTYTDDSPRMAARIAAACRRHYGARHVQVISAASSALADTGTGTTPIAAGTDTIIAVIGPRWLGASSPHDPAHDRVLATLASAIAQGTLVIPVLVDGASVPPETALPQALAPLAERHAPVVRAGWRFAGDMRRLYRSIAIQHNRGGARPFTLWAAVAMLIGTPFIILLSIATYRPQLVVYYVLVMLALTFPTLIQMLREHHWSWAFALILFTVIAVFGLLALISALSIPANAARPLNMPLAFSLLLVGGWALTLARYMERFHALKWEDLPRRSRTSPDAHDGHNSHAAANQTPAAQQSKPRSMPRSRRAARAASVATTTYFLSYRRADSFDACKAFYHLLARGYGPSNVYRDLDMNLGGELFPARLERTLAGCRVALILIGPQWLDIRDNNGQRRLDNPNDFVRMEIAMVLRLRKIVIPVLIGGASAPDAASLPEDIRALASLRMFRIRALGPRWTGLWWELWPIRWYANARFYQQIRRHPLILYSGVALYFGLLVMALTGIWVGIRQAEWVALVFLLMQALTWAGALFAAARERFWGWCALFVGLMVLLVGALGMWLLPLAPTSQLNRRLVPVGGLLALLA